MLADSHCHLDHEQFDADRDAVIERAVAAGARILTPLADQIWGDRMARIIDSARHVWNLAGRVEEQAAPE